MKGVLLNSDIFMCMFCPGEFFHVMGRGVDLKWILQTCFFFVCVFVMSYINVFTGSTCIWKITMLLLPSLFSAFQPFQTFVASWSQTPGHLFTAFWLRSPRANPSTKASACCPRGRRCTMTTQAPHHRQKGKLKFLIKALFNINASTFKTSELHGPTCYQCLWKGVEMKPWKNCTAKASLSASKEWQLRQVTRFTTY